MIARRRFGVRQDPVLLAVDEELGKVSGGGVRPVGADPVDPIEVGQHEDVYALGAGSGTEGVLALT